MKIYIAGKIAGDRRYRAKFREAAKALEAAKVEQGADQHVGGKDRGQFRRRRRSLHGH